MIVTMRGLVLQFPSPFLNDLLWQSGVLGEAYEVKN
jgi:hypothetical protein